MANQPRPFTAREERIGNVVVKAMSRLNTWVYRVTSGRLGGQFMYGAPVLLLITKGRKSGERRTAPLLYLKDGENYVVVASKGGMSQHPLWFRNIEADPDVEIEIEGTTTAMTARPVSDEEKQALWSKLIEMYPPYDQYQARTERNIPVVELSPRG